MRGFEVSKEIEKSTQAKLQGEGSGATQSESFAFKKILLLPLVVFLGCLVAGLCMAINYVIAFGMSPEYFGRGDFDSFLTWINADNYAGIAFIGFVVGAFFGIPKLVVLSALGLFAENARIYFQETLIAYLVAAISFLLMTALMLLSDSGLEAQDRIQVALDPPNFNLAVAFILACATMGFRRKRRLKANSILDQ